MLRRRLNSIAEILAPKIAIPLPFWGRKMAATARVLDGHPKKMTFCQLFLEKCLLSYGFINKY